MSIGAMGGVFGSAAGAPLAQTSGSDVERAGQDASTHTRQVTTNEQASSAAGIAETDGKDTQTHDRDADGRRLWEFGHRPGGHDGEAAPAAEPPQSKDVSGERGNELDLTG